MKRYALLGPPNVGKSTLFYTLTGVYVKTGNYPGTTVEIHRAYLKWDGEKIEIVDLPGIEMPKPQRSTKAPTRSSSTLYSSWRRNTKP